VKHVLQAVVSRFVTLYGEPRTDNAEALYSEYVRALKDFDQEALDAAVDEVVRYHTFPTWPMPGEVYKQALTEAAKLYAKRHKPAPAPEQPKREDGRHVLTEEQKAHNRRMIEELKRQTVTQRWEMPTLPVPDRPYMEQLQADAMRTADGRNRHLRGGWRPDMTKPDGGAE
jgi:hypothetical protein